MNRNSARPAPADVARDSLAPGETYRQPPPRSPPLKYDASKYTPTYNDPSPPSRTVHHNAYRTRGDAADNAYRTRGEAADNAYRTRGEAADNAYMSRGDAADNAYRTRGDAADNAYMSRGEAADNSYMSRGEAAEQEQVWSTPEQTRHRHNCNRSFVNCEQFIIHCLTCRKCRHYIDTIQKIGMSNTKTDTTTKLALNDAVVYLLMGAVLGYVLFSFSKKQ